MHYCDLFRHYGGVPIVDHAYTAMKICKKKEVLYRKRLILL